MGTMPSVRGNDAFGPWERCLRSMGTMPSVHRIDAFGPWERCLRSLGTMPSAPGNDAFGPWERCLRSMDRSHPPLAPIPSTSGIDPIRPWQRSLPLMGSIPCTYGIDAFVAGNDPLPPRQRSLPPNQNAFIRPTKRHWGDRLRGRDRKKIRHPGQSPGPDCEARLRAPPSPAPRSAAPFATSTRSARATLPEASVAREPGAEADAAPPEPGIDPWVAREGAPGNLAPGFARGNSRPQVAAAKAVAPIVRRPN